jgi:hypothetical protein
MGKFIRADFDGGMKFGHKFLEAEWLVTCDQQRAFGFEEKCMDGPR